MIRKLYTVNHKKRDILFLTITIWLILTNFYSFYIILITTLLRFMNHSKHVVLIFPGKVRTEIGWCDKFYCSCM